MVKSIYRRARMSLRKENYIDRLIDNKIKDYLTIFGAIKY